LIADRAAGDKFSHRRQPALGPYCVKAATACYRNFGRRGLPCSLIAPHAIPGSI
jgi:hypothetical protein